MIRLNQILKELTYLFSEPDVTYDEQDNSIITVEYTFKTKENKYRVVITSIEKPREFEVSFGVDTGAYNKIDTFQMTGEGTAKNILETVASIVNDFYSKYRGEVDNIVIKGTNEKRSNVYKQFFPKYLDKKTMEKTQIQ